MTENSLQAVIRLVEERTHPPMIVALDGMAAAGKTTAAELLSRRWNAPVIHMDDFFLPPEKRTPQRYSEPGGNVDYERFLEEVLPSLRAHEAFSYRVFDCSTMTMARERTIPASPVVIVEGACALHPAFGSYADASLFAETDPETQKARIEARNGREGLEVFQKRWIPLETLYHETFGIRDRADIILRT